MGVRYLLAILARTTRTHFALSPCTGVNRALGIVDEQGGCGRSFVRIELGLHPGDSRGT